MRMPQIIHGLTLGAENSAALDFISTDCDAAIQQRHEGRSELQASQEYALGLAGLYKLHLDRTHRAGDIRSYALPELPETKAEEVYDRIEEAERVASQDLTEDGYNSGSATKDDELLILPGHDNLITAEHATFQKRKAKDGQSRASKGPDWGTAGLGTVLSQDTGRSLIVPIGRQTMDANDDMTHPLKDVMTEMLQTGDFSSTVSLHGFGLGRFDKVTDPRAFDVFIGMGVEQEDPACVVAADLLKKIAEGYDLRAGINQWFTTMRGADDFRPKYNEAKGRNWRDRFAAGPQTTRGHAEQIMLQQNMPVLALQAELSPLLRWTPESARFTNDRRRLVMGVYTGYLVVSDYLSQLAELNLHRGEAGV